MREFFRADAAKKNLYLGAFANQAFSVSPKIHHVEIGPGGGANLFFLFVAFRNDWSLNFDALPEQIAGAFSSSPKSDIPEIAQGLTITVGEKKLLEGNPPKLVVRGEVSNQTGEPRQAILLRGRPSSAGSMQP